MHNAITYYLTITGFAACLGALQLLRKVCYLELPAYEWYHAPLSSGNCVLEMLVYYEVSGVQKM